MNQQHADRFGRVVEARARRKRRARQRRESLWFGLGMFGMVGWSVAAPTLIGIALGVWLDARTDTGRISWTLTGLVVGIAVGCALAWFWIRQESRPSDVRDDHERDREEPDDEPR